MTGVQQGRDRRCSGPLEELGGLEGRLIARYQRGLPLTPRPFAAVGKELGATEDEVLHALQGLRKRGILSRLGPVFRPHAVGASTLAALAVPTERLERVAEIVNAFPEVNHNYERTHRYNLWFVVAARDRAGVESVLNRIGQTTGLVPLDLPLIRDFHIDLGFSLEENGQGLREVERQRGPTPTLEASDQRLIEVVQDGFPLSPAPFADVAEESGLGEGEVLARLADWQAGQLIRRIGLVVRHHELGYRANGMVVWAVEEGRVAEVGQAMARYPFVTLCYQRPSREPHWPYTLFTMIHGRSQSRVEVQAEALARDAGAGRCPREILFSRRRFKQRGARYR